MLSSLFLLVGLAAYCSAPVSMASFWLFNRRLWIAQLLAFLAAVLLAGGVSGVLWTIEYLFGLQVPGWLHGKVWIIALGLVAPLNWLSLIPERFDQPVTEGEQTEFTSRAVALQVKFALVPLLLVYAVILHAYAVKILLDGSLPKGRLGWMVLTYGALVAITALLAFPTRSQGGPLVRFFWRAWPWLLPAPVALLFIAVGERIHQYGLTEGRYLSLMAGLWLAALAASQGLVQAERRDLRLIPGLLAMLLGVASFGP
jgi:hypothetical protein